MVSLCKLTRFKTDYIINVHNTCNVLMVFDLLQIYPTEIRSLGSGCGNAMARLGGMITPYIAQVLFSAYFSFSRLIIVFNIKH